MSSTFLITMPSSVKLIPKTQGSFEVRHPLQETNVSKSSWSGAEGKAEKPLEGGRDDGRGGGKIVEGQVVGLCIDHGHKTGGEDVDSIGEARNIDAEQRMNARTLIITRFNPGSEP